MGLLAVVDAIHALGIGMLKQQSPHLFNLHLAVPTSLCCTVTRRHCAHTTASSRVWSFATIPSALASLCHCHEVES